MFCRWCGSTLKKRKPELGEYCKRSCRENSAMALLEAMEGAERATKATATAQPGFLDEIGAVVAEGGENMVARLMGRFVGAYGPAITGKVKEVVAGHIGRARAEQAGHAAQAAGTGTYGAPQGAWSPGWGATGIPGHQQQARHGAAESKARAKSPPPPPPPPRPRQTPRQTEKSVLLGQLSLPPDATLQDVEERYRDLARSLHPDVAGGDGGPMKQLNATRSRLRQLMK